MICVNCGRVVTDRHWYKQSGKPRCWDRFWTKARDFELMKHWEHGLSDAEIADRMGTTAASVNLHRKRIGLKRGYAHQQVMTAREVQRRMGIGCSKTVTRWIDAGWLAARRGKGIGRHHYWFVTEPALLAFLDDPDHWQEWDPERITDPMWRRHADAVRGDVRFLTLGQAAERFGVEVGTVGQWIDKGWLPVIRRGRGNHLVRSDDVDRLAPTYVYGEGLKIA